MSVSKTHAFDTDVLSDWFYNKHRLSIFNHLFIIYKNISNHTIIITFNLIHKRLRNPHRFRQLILTQSQLYSLFSNHFFIVLQNPSP